MFNDFIDDPDFKNLNLESNEDSSAVRKIKHKHSKRKHHRKHGCKKHKKGHSDKYSGSDLGMNCRIILNEK